MSEVANGLTGRISWIRRRVWFWQRSAYERNGWHKSPTEGNIRPMMIKQIDAQREMNRIFSNTMSWLKINSL